MENGTVRLRGGLAAIPAAHRGLPPSSQSAQASASLSLPAAAAPTTTTTTASQLQSRRSDSPSTSGELGQLANGALHQHQAHFKASPSSSAASTAVLANGNGHGVYASDPRLARSADDASHPRPHSAHLNASADEAARRSKHSASHQPPQHRSTTNIAVNPDERRGGAALFASASASIKVDAGGGGGGGSSPPRVPPHSSSTGASSSVPPPANSRSSSLPQRGVLEASLLPALDAVASEQRERLERLGRERLGGASARTRHAAMEGVRQALLSAEQGCPGLCEAFVAELLKTLVHPNPGGGGAGVSKEELSAALQRLRGRRN